MTSADVTSAFNQLCGHWSALIIVHDREPIYVDWDFNSWWVAQPSIPCPTHFEHEHTQSWLLLLDMRDDLHPIDTITLLAVIEHYVDTWFLYIIWFQEVAADKDAAKNLL